VYVHTHKLRIASANAGGDDVVGCHLILGGTRRSIMLLGMQNFIHSNRDQEKSQINKNTN
jgi:hypothetical protein